MLSLHIALHRCSILGVCIRLGGSYCEEIRHDCNHNKHHRVVK